MIAQPNPLQRLAVSTAGAVAATCLSGIGTVQAQPAGTTERTLSSSSRSAPPVGVVGRSRLPLINPSVYPPGGRATTTRTRPTGTPSASGEDEFGSQAIGTGTQEWPYTIARVAVTTQGPSNNKLQTPVCRAFRSAPPESSGCGSARAGSSAPPL
jgi:hypothetical protein